MVMAISIMISYAASWVEKGDKMSVQHMNESLHHHFQNIMTSISVRTLVQYDPVEQTVALKRPSGKCYNAWLRAAALN